MLEKRHLFGRPDTKPLLEFRRDILELKSGTRRDANGHSALGPQLRWSWVGAPLPRVHRQPPAAQGGTLSLHNRPDGGLEARVRLPAKM
jgi:hypothetical protein